jgi:transcription termination/antitermination protein NusG
MGLDQLVEAVEVPTEKVTEVRRGKKVTSDKKFFPGPSTGSGQATCSPN